MEYLQELTESQRQAVTHRDGPMLVLAGPGSGKTRVVTSRVAHLLHQDIPPHNILALTFTNKAADEMRNRLQMLAPGNPVWMSTFHRFCSRMLRQYADLVGLRVNFRIYDTEDALKTLKAAIEESDIPLLRYTPAQVARSISNAKNRLASPEQFSSFASQPLDVIAAEVYPEYQKRLMESNAVDFDDLLMHIAVLLRDNAELRRELDAAYRYILVDEYQDTNLAQYTIVRALSIDYPNLSVTGDPDQSIYAWRGADIKNILEFERDYPQVKVVRLEQNYRSTKRILEVADQLIANNQHRKPKSLFTDNATGSPVRIVCYEDALNEADDIVRQIGDSIRQGEMRARDFAVLFRTNALTRNFEHAFREYGVPYQIVNGVAFYQRKEIKDVLAYLHLMNNPRDTIAFSRVINTPPRGIGKKTLQYLRDHAVRHRLTMLEAAADCHRIDRLTPRAQTALGKFIDIFSELQKIIDQPVEAVVGRVLMDTGYRDHLKDSTSEEDQQRLANIDELTTAAKQFDDKFEEGGRLEEFLEQTSLVADTDAWDSEDDRVTLMTLHAAKGLEFPSVFIVALEQGVLPHERSHEDPMRMEEERRLLFVGITRAEQYLQLSLTCRREFRGSIRYTVPSNFLMELPRQQMECIGFHLSRSLGNQGTPTGSGLGFQEDGDELATEWAETERLEQAVEQFFHDQSESETPAGSSTSPPMRTAAELMRAVTGDSAHMTGISPDRFALGMLVTHPEYGPGKIISLSGKGMKRAATIQFLQPPERKTIHLAYSPVRPLSA